MYHLKLIKGLSYYGGGIKATKKTPDVYVEDEASANAALASGYFKLVSVSEEQEVPPPAEGEPAQDSTPGKTLDDMTVAELETFATYKGVSLKGVRGKDNIIAALKGALGTEDTENEVDYGSPTMVELQEQ